MSVRFVTCHNLDAVLIWVPGRLNPHLTQFGIFGCFYVVVHGECLDQLIQQPRQVTGVLM